MVHEVIPTCAENAALPIYKCETCHAGYNPGSSDGKALVRWTNDTGSNPWMDIFILCWFYDVCLLIKMCEVFKIVRDNTK